jgi:hypothetical protein
MSQPSNTNTESSDDNNQRSLMNRLSFGLLGKDDQATTENAEIESAETQSSEIEPPEVESTVENSSNVADAEATAE